MHRNRAQTRTLGIATVAIVALSEVLTAQDIGVFVSSSSVAGDFGGLGPADSTCQSLGTAALPGSGPWVAWISDSTTDARDRIPQPGSEGAYVRATQPESVIANDLADLTNGDLDLEIGDFDENGNPGPPGKVWTGTNSDGTVAAETCLDWASTVVGGVVGNRFSMDSSWTHQFSAACD